MAVAPGMIQMEPMEPKFAPSTTGGGFAFSHHKITNTGKQKVAMKMKCSDNRVYRLRPVFSLLEPGKDLTLTIARLPVPDKKDKLVIQAILLRPDQTDAQAAWKGRVQPPDAQISILLMLAHKPAVAAPATVPAASQAAPTASIAAASAVTQAPPQPSASNPTPTTESKSPAAPKPAVK